MTETEGGGLYSRNTCIFTENSTEPTLRCQLRGANSPEPTPRSLLLLSYDKVLHLWTSNHVKAIGMTEEDAMYYHINPKHFKKFRPTISIDLEGSDTKSIDLVRIRSAGGNFALGKLTVTRKVDKTTIKMYIKAYKKLNRFLMSF
eukprot:jgi/Psemu1/39994/gm1.39994_g